MLSTSFILLSFAIAATAFHSFNWKHQANPLTSSAFSYTKKFEITKLSKNFPPLYSADTSPSLSDSTVVSRCTQKITDSLQPTECIVTSTDSDPNGSHIQIVCIATIFEGKTSVQRQRLVYKAIWDEMSGPVHAVDSIIAKTPAEMGN